MSTKHSIYGIFAALIIGVGIGYVSKPAEIEIREVRVIDTTKRTEIDTDKRKVVTEERKPDGTVIRREEEIDKSKERTEETKREVVEQERIEKRQPEWSVGAYYGLDRSYTLTLDRRIIGNVWVGMYGRAAEDFRAPTVGVGIRLTF